MVESLKVEIALDGSEEVQSKMYNIGAAGRTAFLGIAKAAGELSIVLGTIGVALGIGVTKKLIDFAEAAEQTEKALTQLQKVSGRSIENLSAMATVFAQGGTELKKFAAEFGNLAEKIAAAGLGAAIRNAGKDTAAWANDLDNLRSKFNNLANVRISFNPLTTLDAKVKALLELLSRVPQVDQWSKLADIFSSLASELDRVQIGKALGLSPETIATLSRGADELQRMEAEASRLGLTLTTSNQQALQEMAQAWNQFSALLAQFFQKIGALAAPAFTTMLNSFKEVMQQIVSDFQNLPRDQALSNLGSRLAPVFSALETVLTPIVAGLGRALGNAIVDGIIASLSQGWENIKNKWGFGGGAPTPSGAPPGLAAGGLLGGRGTGTSDSNLAWLSRGEHIMPARAVSQPGVLAFLEALRHSGGNLSAVLNGMGRFALGGMVPRSIPAFAAGGLNGGNHVTIQFPGLPAIGGLRASSEVVDQLHKAAALAQVRSGGRKPSRYR